MSGPSNPIYDSGILAGDTLTHQVPAIDWDNGETYRAWVRVQQTGGQWSAWTPASAFPITWTPPAAPSGITSNTGVTPHAITISGISGRDLLQVQHSVDGVTYTDLVSVPVVGASKTLAVPLTPYGIPGNRYRARVSDTVDGVQVWSDWAEVIFTGTDTNTYLVADDGLSYLPVHLSKASEPADTAGVAISYALGASRPVVIRTPSQGRVGTEMLAVVTQADKLALQAWLEANPVFWFRYPPERAGSTYVDVPPVRMTPAAGWSEQRFVNAQAQLREIPLPWVEQ